MADKSSTKEVLGDPGLAEYYKKREALIDRMANDPDPEAIVNWYQNEGAAFDAQFEKAGFGYLPLFVDGVETLVKDKQAKILDVGAGSGKIALKLRERGYTNIDGVDGSSEMLKLAKERNAYNKYICCMVGAEKMPGVPDSSYDVICCAAAIGRGHLAVNSIPTMLRAARPNGYLLFNHQSWSGQFEDFSDEKFELCFEDLKEKGICSGVEKKECELRPGEPSHIYTLRRGEGVPT